MTLIAVAVCLALLSGSLWAIWLDWETEKARKKFDRIAQANSESVGWPPPKGPKGWNGRGRAA